MDISYLLFLQGIRETTGGIFNSFFLFMTSMGEQTMILLVLAGLYWCVNKRLGQQLLFIYTLANVFLQIVKLTVCAYRPWIRSADIVPPAQVKAGATGYSFPSGHTLKAAVTWGGLGVCFHQLSAGGGTDALQRQMFRWLRNFFLILIVLIAFSRNYFGVHTPQDVVVGAALGLIFVFVGRRLWDWQEQGHAWGLFLGGLLLSALVSAYISLKGYPMDYVDGKLMVDPMNMIIDGWYNIGAFLGFLFSWPIERRWIHFAVPSSWPERLCCYLLGAAGLLLLMKVVPHCLYAVFSLECGIFIDAALPFVYILVLYPWLWKCLCDKRTQG